MFNFAFPNLDGLSSLLLSKMIEVEDDKKQEAVVMEALEAAQQIKRHRSQFTSWGDSVIRDLQEAMRKITEVGRAPYTSDIRINLMVDFAIATAQLETNHAVLARLCRIVLTEEELAEFVVDAMDAELAAKAAKEIADASFQAQIQAEREQA